MQKYTTHSNKFTDFLNVVGKVLWDKHENEEKKLHI